MDNWPLKIEDVPLGGRGGPRINIIAGVTRFTTTRSTLTSRDPGSKLAKLKFTGTPNHHYFLDINPSVFEHILDYLRYGKLVLPDNFDQHSLLREQATQLEMWSLVEELSKEEAEEDTSESSAAEDGWGPPKKKARRRQRKSKKRWMATQDIEDMLGRLEEGFHGLISKLEEQMDNNEKEDMRQAGQQLDKVVKTFEEGIRRLTDNHVMNIENIIRNQEMRLMYEQPVGSPAPQTGIIFVLVSYYKLGKSRFYEIDVFSKPDMPPQLDVPDVARQHDIGSMVKWTYKDFSLCTCLTSNIAYQLTKQGYNLITATECCLGDDNGCPQYMQYVFVRS